MKTTFSILIALICSKSIILAQLTYPTAQSWGKLKDGREVQLYTFKTAKGAELSITNYGATVVSIKMPNRDSVMHEITTGVDNIEAYQKGTPSFGATVGRYANRIAKGQFSVEGSKTIHQLYLNDGPNALHGGKENFSKKLWNSQIIGNKLHMSYISPSGEESYPGEYKIEVIFSLSEDNEFRIVYQAQTDAPTIHNVTNHTYFNLDGFGKKPTILNHEIKIEADSVTEIGPGLIPTGKIVPIAGTALDFRNFETIGKNIDSPSLTMPDGFDHNYVMNNKANELKLMATLKSNQSGRIMEVYSSEPGIQFYSGNFMRKSYPHRKGEKYRKRAALCLETQHFPDSPNHPNFPSTTLLPGQEFKSVTVYKFGIFK